jgi:peptidoglycan/LPS O-acetylase OafA/YrhL
MVKMLLLRGFGGFYSFPENAQHMLNPALWTIPIEFGCYMTVAALAVLGHLRRRAILIAAGLAYACCGFFFVARALSLAGLPPLARNAENLALPEVLSEICAFLLGATFHTEGHRIPWSNKIALGAAAALAIAMRVPPLVSLVLPPSVAYLVFFSAYHPRVNLRHFARENDLSYGIYLWGWPLLQVLTRLLPHLNGVTIFLVAMPVVCGVAFLSWRWIERQSLNLKRAHRGPREAAGVP